MSTIYQKIIAAKELLIEAETELIDTRGFCPYEVGFCIRNIEDALNAVGEE